MHKHSNETNNFFSETNYYRVVQAEQPQAPFCTLSYLKPLPLLLLVTVTYSSTSL